MPFATAVEVYSFIRAVFGGVALAITYEALKY